MDFTKLFDTGCNIQQVLTYSIKYIRLYIKERSFNKLLLILIYKYISNPFKYQPSFLRIVKLYVTQTDLNKQTRLIFNSKNQNELKLKKVVL
jgi:hypothetical protein